MKKNLIVFGTRPEAIKMAPLVKAFQKHQDIFETKVCITAQHREMLDQVLDFFEITPDYDLDLMKPNQNLYSLTAGIIENMKPVLEDFQPDYVYVHGDTTTTMAAALAAFYSGAEVCHVEAGLRTFNKRAPFPEEINRSIAGRLADYHFPPTDRSKENLVNEAVSEENIIITGNTVIDALLFSVDKLQQQNYTDQEIEMVQQEVDTIKKHVIGLRSDGTIWGWGYNGAGLLGLGSSTTDDYLNPTQEATGATDWTAISVAESHTVALKSNGTLWSWGGPA